MKCSHNYSFESAGVRWGVNCGGFALNNPRWVKLEAFSKFARGTFNFQTDDDMVDEVAEACARELLKRYTTLRRIENEKELKENEYLVAFRIGDLDYHYMKKVDGVWYHKMGRTRYESIDEMEVLTYSAWLEQYYSEIILFAKRV